MQTYHLEGLSPVESETVIGCGTFRIYEAKNRDFKLYFEHQDASKAETCIGIDKDFGRISQKMRYFANAARCKLADKHEAALQNA